MVNNIIKTVLVERMTDTSIRLKPLSLRIGQPGFRTAEMGVAFSERGCKIDVRSAGCIRQVCAFVDGLTPLNGFLTDVEIMFRSISSDSVLSLAEAAKLQTVIVWINVEFYDCVKAHHDSHINCSCVLGASVK